MLFQGSSISVLPQHISDPSEISSESATEKNPFPEIVISSEKQNGDVAEPNLSVAKDEPSDAPKSETCTPNGVQPIPVHVNSKVETSTPTKARVAIPVLHINTSPVSSRSSTEELWTPRVMEDTQERNEKMMSSISFSSDILDELRSERSALERELRVFSESIPLMSDDCVTSLRQRMSKRIDRMESGFHTFAEGRSTTRRHMKFIFDDGEHSRAFSLFSQLAN